MQDLVLTEDRRDCLQELTNVAMGQAGDSLARYLEVFVELSVPLIRLVKINQLKSGLVESATDNSMVSAVRQSFYDSQDSKGIRGEAIVIFSDACFNEISALLAYDGAITQEVESEILLDITNVLNGACLSGLGEQLGKELAFSPPSVIGQHILPHNVLQEDKITWESALKVEINYTVENRCFQCGLFLLMPDASIETLFDMLDELLED